ncbi:hypothetical protein [Rufibacter psychrotolerans]|uniref:hypothetical protein n=1 Tax=Rufibacter psychrotolerans TaxID=2812556 RepID=UPI0019687D69|nr:hypothetical protein [Rufibacter sp. SYSU D00308]
MKNLLLCLFIATGCTSPQHETKKFVNQDFGAFSINIPQTWKRLDAQGIDSYVGMIAIDGTDTLSFDLGQYSSNLEDEKVYMVRDGEIYVFEEVLENKEPTVNSIYKYVGLVGEVDTLQYIKEQVEWVEIDKRKAKLVKPKKSGLGTTGVYIDSLWGKGYAIDKFQINGRNLKPTNEKDFLEALKTLRFKQIQ